MKKNWKKVFSYLFIFIFFALAIGPFLIPVPELDGLVSEEEFMDEDGLGA